MTSTRIALTADQALSHASRLLAAGGDVTTSRSVTSGLAGGDTADAEKTFHLWLQERATDLGTAADELRSAVLQNADALRQAAHDLLERDAVSADAADRFTAAMSSASSSSADAARADLPAGPQDAPAAAAAAGAGTESA